MRTNEERQQLIHRRTLEIQREQQKKRERVISGSGIAACLMIIIGIGCLMPEVTKQASVSGAKTNYTTGMASMLGNYEALGYICIVCVRRKNIEKKQKNINNRSRCAKTG